MGKTAGTTLSARRSGLRGVHKRLRPWLAALLGLGGLLLVTLAWVHRAEVDPRSPHAVRDGDWALTRLSEKLAAQLPETGAIASDALAAQLATSASAPLVLDVRAVAEFTVSHLPGAVHIDPSASGAALTPEALAMRAGRPVDAAATSIVVYCSVGGRSRILGARLLEQGYRDVRNLERGIFGWAREGRALVDADGRGADRVHGYGPPWQWLLPAEIRAQ